MSVMFLAIYACIVVAAVGAGAIHNLARRGRRPRAAAPRTPEAAQKTT